MDLEKIEKLHELKEKGILSNEEFKKEKQKLLEKTDEGDDLKEDCSRLGIVKGSFYALVSALKRWKDFKGRTTRFDFWGASISIFLFYFVFFISCGLFGAMCEYNTKMFEKNTISLLLVIAGFLISFISFVVMWLYLTLYVRRLHDVNMSGWWCLTIIIPLIISFIKSGKGENKFGQAFKTNEDRALVIIIVQIFIQIVIQCVMLMVPRVPSDNNSISNNNYNSQYHQPSYDYGYYH